MLEDLRYWSLEQPNILVPVTLLMQINYFKVTFCYSAHEPLVHVMVHFSRIKVWVMQNFLDEILDESSVDVLNLSKILQDALACSEETKRLGVQLRQHSKLQVYVI